MINHLSSAVTVSGSPFAIGVKLESRQRDQVLTGAREVRMTQQRPPRVAILADATPEAGVGHVMRCLALAEAMESEGSEVVWVSQMTVSWLRSYLEENHYRVCNRPKRWIHTLAMLIKSEIDIALVDTYEDASDQITQMEKAGIHVVQIFDGFGVASVSASVVLNPENYLGSAIKSNGGSVTLDGPEYALIRQEIRDLAKRRSESGRGRNFIQGVAQAPLVVVIAGGSDSRQLLDVSAWTVVAERLNSTVVLGPAGPGPPPTQEGGEARGGVILKSGADLLRDAAAANWVVSGSGVTSWELMHIGVPTGLFCVSDNQRNNFEFMTSRGWALDMNDLVVNISRSFSADPWRRAHDYLSSQPWQSQRVDGLGASRVATAVVKSMEHRRLIPT